MAAPAAGNGTGAGCGEAVAGTAQPCVAFEGPGGHINTGALTRCSRSYMTERSVLGPSMSFEGCLVAAVLLGVATRRGAPRRWVGLVVGGPVPRHLQPARLLLQGGCRRGVVLLLKACVCLEWQQLLCCSSLLCIVCMT